MMRRLFDLTTAALTLLVLGPAMLAIALLVRTTMGGPVLFRQTRSGHHGREFRILKFRSMRHPRHPDEPDKDRITRLGHILRTTSLDELPQLINVLRGDMGVIGPRPTLPEQVAHYSERQRGRLAVRPGLTGWAQVQGRNALTWPERIEYDLHYVDHRGIRLDLRILWRTVGVLLRPVGITGAGGVNPGFPIPGQAAAPAAHPGGDTSAEKAAPTPAGHPGPGPTPSRDPGAGPRKRSSPSCVPPSPWTIPYTTSPGMAPPSAADPVPAEEAS
ncbi:sugar transferase [Yinghuangia sp. ASG 101]|uniref:sugar transferase n=1 Tax=Yinghuangia sp. ASG 101 TaxID=2896848 RepID=UPI001E53773E|nr:sugar transferase [Yinghuangia sp. ASG 101]UGQ10595.1 sugar transferase [Yinghuangia sp. ASG 101]